MLELITEFPITFLNVIHSFVFIVTQEWRVTLNSNIIIRVSRFSVELTGNKNICNDTNGPHIGSVWNRVVVYNFRRNKFGCSEIDLKLLMWNISSGQAKINQFYVMTIRCYADNIFFTWIHLRKIRKNYFNFFENKFLRKFSVGTGF